MTIIEALSASDTATIADVPGREYMVMIRSGLLTFQTRYEGVSGWTQWAHTYGVPERAFLSTHWLPVDRDIKPSNS